MTRDQFHNAMRILLNVEVDELREIGLTTDNMHYRSCKQEVSLRIKDPAKVAAGKARSDKMTPERRSEIARKAAAAKWGTLREAISQEGKLNVGGAELERYVLDDETRVLARASFVRAIGRKGKVKGGRKFDEEFQVPVFLTAENLKPFFPKDLDQNSKPILFTHGDQQMIGYRAELLADVCDIFADADRAGVLRANQRHIADATRLLSRGLTRVGIIGLVDEATGYQRERAANALAKVLERFIAKDIGMTGVWNRDIRAGGITDARQAGANLDDVSKAAGHAGKAITARVYDRDTLEHHRRVRRTIAGTRSGTRDNAE